MHVIKEGSTSHSMTGASWCLIMKRTMGGLNVLEAVYVTYVVRSV